MHGASDRPGHFPHERPDPDLLIDGVHFPDLPEDLPDLFVVFYDGQNRGVHFGPGVGAHAGIARLAATDEHCVALYLNHFF